MIEQEEKVETGSGVGPGDTPPNVFYVHEETAVPKQPPYVVYSILVAIAMFCIGLLTDHTFWPVVNTTNTQLDQCSSLSMTFQSGPTTIEENAGRIRVNGTPTYVSCTLKEPQKTWFVEFATSSLNNAYTIVNQGSFTTGPATAGTNVLVDTK